MKLVERARRYASRLRPVSLPDVAWFDGPDALREVEERSGGNGADRVILESWVTNGYAVVEDVVAHDAIDAMLDDLDDAFRTDAAIEGLEFCDLEFADDGHRATVDHATLLSHPVDVRWAARNRSNWRVHALMNSSPSARAVSRSPELRRVASMILGIDTEPSYSINFHNGSRQDLHQDTCVFHLGVPNLIVGAWIACEDIEAGCGPLVYYPGSHRGPLYDEFDDYPNTNLRTADDARAARYTRWVQADAERFDEHRFLARKGDVLFWHGMLIHGGAPIERPELTRRSFVVHFVPHGADHFQRVTLPARW